MNIPKIAIIGAGSVGSQTAFALLLRHIPAEIYLIDQNEKFEEGHVMDLSDATLFTEAGIFSGSLQDAARSDIIIMTAGVAQKPGESRMDLVGRNLEVMRQIKQKMGTLKPEALVIVVSNPVDILTHFIAREWGLGVRQVFGTGTILDSARLRRALSEKFQVHPNSTHGWVLGEHGQTEFVAWSTVKIGGIAANDNGFSDHEKKQIENQVRQKAFEIIERKGSTYFGIATCTAEIIWTILADTKRVYPLSVPLFGEFDLQNVALGVPAILGINGVEKVMEIDLNSDEIQKISSSAKALQEIIKQF